MLPKGLVDEARALSDRITEWRRALHAMPELRMDTPLTEAYIAQRLAELGAEDIRTGVGGHGVTAMISGGRPGPCLGIRADCDALPIREETGLPFASQNGNMHACGHDAHTAMLLGAAELLIRHRDALAGSVKLIFQPYEEGGGGADLMMKDGVLDGVERVIGLHTGNVMGTQYENGHIAIPRGSASANIWGFRAEFHGVSAHVATPEAAVDPIAMAARAALRIKSEVASRRENGRPAIAAVTVFRAGIRNNIIPDTCVIEGSVRAFDAKLHAAMREEVSAIIREEAAGGSVDVSSLYLIGGIVNDAAMADAFAAVAGELFPADIIHDLDAPVPIGEDFSRYLAAVPGLYFFLSSKPEGECYPHHSPRFDIDESVLYRGAALFAGYALASPSLKEE